MSYQTRGPGQTLFSGRSHVTIANTIIIVIGIDIAIGFGFAIETIRISNLIPPPPLFSLIFALFLIGNFNGNYR